MRAAMNGQSPLAQALAERTLLLCRIPSPIGDERVLADHVETWARNHRPGSTSNASRTRWWWERSPIPAR